MSPRARRQPQDNTNTATMTPPSTPAVVSGSPTSSPQSRLERIAQRAYAIYERRGGENGSSMDDWLQAEREIDAEA
jgi:hypothetical protein